MTEARPVFLFAHGAGAGSTSQWMQEMSQLLGQLGDVHCFDYEYMQAGRRAPDRLPKLLVRHRAELEALRGRFPGRPVFLAGKSMGGRVGCHLALEESVCGVICFGYPLLGRNGVVRSEVLRSLDTAVLFIQGTRDSLCPVMLLKSTVEDIKAPTSILWIEGGNHSLAVGRRALEKQELTQNDLNERIASSIREFVQANR